MADNRAETTSPHSKLHKASETPGRRNGFRMTGMKWLILILAALLAAAGFLVKTAMDQYETGIIEICADEQDGYVQLVLDQINLRDNRTDSEIISNILETLDASSSRYWTFSKGENVLFVKNTLETRRYQSVSADSYYASQESEEFMNSLRKDRVTHAILTIGGENYVASGVVFTYGGSDYRLCLLTDESVLMDNNIFLGAKVQLLMFIGGLLLALFLLAVMAAGRRNLLVQRNGELEEQCGTLNRSVENLNEKLTLQDIFNARGMVFPISLLAEFDGRLRKEEEAWPVSVIVWHYGIPENRKVFLGDAFRLLGKKELLFDAQDKGALVILCLQCDLILRREIERNLGLPAAEVQAETLYGSRYGIQDAVEKMLVRRKLIN